MREKSGRHIDDLRISEMMKEFGFNPEASSSTARALILNLVRSAYGAEAAREFMRQINLDKNRDVVVASAEPQFKETQMSLFDVSSPVAGDEVPGTLLQKKSRRA